MNNYFDRQLSLTELFSDKEIATIQTSLSSLLDQDLVVEDRHNSLPDDQKKRKAINWDLEPIGYLATEKGSTEQLERAVSLMHIMVQKAARYRMAKDIHQEIVTRDYEALEKKHQALQESETRYKKLSTELEQQVAKQVKIIQTNQTKLYQAEKQAAVGHLAAGMAHEINNPLAYVQNNLYSASSYLESLQTIQETIQKTESPMLKKAWEEEDMDFILEDFPALLGDSLEGIKKVAAIVADLKIFSDIDRTEMAFDNINARLETVLRVLAPQLPEEIEIIMEPGELPTLNCDPARIGELFHSLIQNAVQAIDGEGQIVIQTATKGEDIQVSIQDSGRGIAREHLTHIFDPFFTTREVGQGTGLGLAVCQDIIKSHGGSIKVESPEQKGTTFTILFPPGK